ncbi:MAG: hypothetical protein ACKOED_11870 [Aestuariivirga sp.]|jgi:hypothetical protein
MSRGRNFFAEMRHRLDRMADGIFDNAITPEWRDDAARDEFTADFTAWRNTAMRGQSGHRNRRHHTEW